MQLLAPYNLSMTSRLRPLIFPSSAFICPSCTRRIRLLGSANQKRFITQNYLQKSLEAKLQWARQATEIKAGRKESMLDMLEKRGYVNQIVGPRDELDKLLTEKRVGIYCGVDPTAPSMHIGHLLPLMVLYWFYIKGFHACSLVRRPIFTITLSALLITYSLEARLHRLEILRGERLAERSSILRCERQIC